MQGLFAPVSAHIRPMLPELGRHCQDGQLTIDAADRDFSSLERKFDTELERPSVVQRVRDLSEIRRSQLAPRLSELRMIEEVQALRNEFQRGVASQ